MKNQAMAVMVAAALLLAASGGTQAAGKLGGAGSGLEIAGVSGPFFAGKLGGVTGEDIGAYVTEPEDVPGIGIMRGGKIEAAGGGD